MDTTIDPNPMWWRYYGFTESFEVIQQYVRSTYSKFAKRYVYMNPSNIKNKNYKHPYQLHLFIENFSYSVLQTLNFQLYGPGQIFFNS